VAGPLDSLGGGHDSSTAIVNGPARGVHPEDFDRYLTIYLDAFARREPFVMEFRLRHRDGNHRWIVDYGRPFTAETGEFAGYLGSCFDIDDRKRVEEALLRSEQSPRDARPHGLHRPRGTQRS
jgi:two-component system NtrC family sensor kinase